MYCLYPVKDGREGAILFKKKDALLELIILVLCMQWVLGFFGHSLIPGIHLSGFSIYVLSFTIVILILFRFVT